MEAILEHFSNLDAYGWAFWIFLVGNIFYFIAATLDEHDPINKR